MNKFKKATEFAREKHKGQTRKFDGSPYITHPIAVSRLAEKYGADEDTQIAALLHDLCEDTNTTCDEVKAKFGNNIARIVVEVTNDDKKRKELGKGAYMNQKAANMSDDALLLKLVDRLHNISDYDTADKGFVANFSKRTFELMEYIKANKVLTAKHKIVIKEIEAINNEYYSRENI